VHTLDLSVCVNVSYVSALGDVHTLYLSNCGYVFLEDCYGDRIYHYVGKIVHE
jgi:hypothetical protein